MVWESQTRGPAANFFFVLVIIFFFVLRETITRACAKPKFPNIEYDYAKETKDRAGFEPGDFRLSE